MSKPIHLTIGKALKTAWIIFIGTSMLVGSIRDLSWIQAYVNINWRLLGLEAVFIAVLLGLVLGLYRTFPKIMGFGIVRLIKKMLGIRPKLDADGKPVMEGGNINFIGIDIKYVGVVICLLILTALPSWAALEEDLFREGTTDWKDGIVRSLIFGFAHMLVGVPVAGVVALTIFGLFLTMMYFIGGVELSTQAHFQYNLILVSMLLVAAIVQSFSSNE